MKPWMREGVELVGVAMIGIGLWLWSATASLVVVGSIVLAASIYGRMRE